jgi:hypothetical protein
VRASSHPLADNDLFPHSFKNPLTRAIFRMFVLATDY